jgi:hypothetical protein
MHVKHSLSSEGIKTDWGSLKEWCSEEYFNLRETSKDRLEKTAY